MHGGFRVKKADFLDHGTTSCGIQQAGRLQVAREGQISRSMPLRRQDNKSLMRFLTRVSKPADNSLAAYAPPASPDDARVVRKRVIWGWPCDDSSQDTGVGPTSGGSR